MNATQLTINTKTTPQVTGRTLLLALGYGIGIGVALGVLTGFGLPRVVPALSSIEWLSTIITTEVYLSLIVGHIIAFGGFWQMRQRLQLGRTPWRNVGMAFLLWLAMWTVFVVIYMVLSSSVAVVSEIGKAIRGQPRIDDPCYHTACLDYTTRGRDHLSRLIVRMVAGQAECKPYHSYYGYTVCSISSAYLLMADSIRVWIAVGMGS